MLKTRFRPAVERLEGRAVPANLDLHWRGGGGAGVSVWSDATKWVDQATGVAPANPPDATDTVFFGHDPGTNIDSNYLCTIPANYNAQCKQIVTKSDWETGGLVGRINLYGNLTVDNAGANPSTWSWGRLLAYGGNLYIKGGRFELRYGTMELQLLGQTSNCYICDGGTFYVGGQPTANYVMHWPMYVGAGGNQATGLLELGADCGTVSVRGDNHWFNYDRINLLTNANVNNNNPGIGTHVTNVYGTMTVANTAMVDYHSQIKVQPWAGTLWMKDGAQLDIITAAAVELEITGMAGGSRLVLEPDVELWLDGGTGSMECVGGMIETDDGGDRLVHGSVTVTNGGIIDLDDPLDTASLLFVTGAMTFENGAGLWVDVNNASLTQCDQVHVGGALTIDAGCTLTVRGYGAAIAGTHVYDVVDAAAGSAGTGFQWYSAWGTSWLQGVGATTVYAKGII